jgi:demethylmenaquinone methyltransferase / 2-methoxy-6-polyprenyl-1,4-benzoquinol methylase
MRRTPAGPVAYHRSSMTATPPTTGADAAWTDRDLADPHAKADKAARVRRMFTAIAPSYDLNNRLHSLWLDQTWRRAAVKSANVQADDVVLDVACGTGDLSMAFADAGAAKIVGVDFTYDMLTIARQKSASPLPPGEVGPERGRVRAATASTRDGQGPGPRPHSFVCPITYHAGDAMRLPIAPASINVVSIAFGIRNVTDPGTAIGEFHRVLRPGGRLVILEFSLPRNRVLRGLYNFYFRHVMPRTATWIARDRSGAYKYLPQSVNTFIDRQHMVALVRDAGFKDVTVKPLTFGIAVIYRGVKK